MRNSQLLGHADFTATNRNYILANAQFARARYHDQIVSIRKAANPHGRGRGDARLGGPLQGASREPSPEVAGRRPAKRGGRLHGRDGLLAGWMRPSPSMPPASSSYPMRAAMIAPRPTAGLLAGCARQRARAARRSSPIWACMSRSPTPKFGWSWPRLAMRCSSSSNPPGPHVQH